MRYTKSTIFMIKEWDGFQLAMRQLLAKIRNPFKNREKAYDETFWPMR